MELKMAIGTFKRPRNFTKNSYFLCLKFKIQFVNIVLVRDFVTFYFSICLAFNSVDIRMTSLKCFSLEAIWNA